MYCEKCDKLGLEFCKCQTTRLIAGQVITLKPGKRYLASRPIFNGKRKIFPVAIKDIDGEPVQIAHIIDDLSLDAANQFINKFNNGPISFNGRVW